MMLERFAFAHPLNSAVPPGESGRLPVVAAITSVLATVVVVPEMETFVVAACVDVVQALKGALVFQVPT